MKKIRLLVLLMAILFASISFAQSSVPVPIGFEAPMGPAGSTNSANLYWDRYPDVANDPYFGRSNPNGAWAHYSQYGQAEGRIWESNITIVGRCNAPVTHGWNCLVFPDGAEITSIQWQSSVKPISHEVLIHLVAGPTGSGMSEPHWTLATTHHIGSGPTIITKPVNLADPFIVAPGWVVWVYAEGYAAVYNLGGLEVQTTIWVRIPTPK